VDDNTAVLGAGVFQGQLLDTRLAVSQDTTRGSDPKNSGASTSTHTCIDCGVPVQETLGGIAICGDCLAARGSCCPEFGAFDLTEDEAPFEYFSPACDAPMFEDANAVQHNRAEQNFFTRSGARLDYRTHRSGELEITHTFVPEDLRGKGLASDLMEAVIKYAEAKKLTINASCSYARSYLQRKQGLPEHG